MGRLKSFYHDEISSRDHTPDPYLINDTDTDTCFVIVERNSNGTANPVQVFTFCADAQDALRLLALGQRVGAEDEDSVFTMTEVRLS